MLIEHFGNTSVTLISQDNYYVPREELPVDEEGDYNYDHPDSVKLHELIRDLKILQQGQEVKLKEYTFNNPSTDAKTITYSPAPIILVEGLFVFYKKELRDMLRLKVFVEADEHIKLSRRIKRDFAERGYSLEEVLAYYEKYVIPMYKKFIQPYKEHVDLILPNNYDMSKSSEVLIDHLEKVISL